MKLMMKSWLILSTCLFVSIAIASETHTEAKEWTTAQLRSDLSTMPTGNVDTGKNLHSSMMCSSCHGVEGIAPTSNWPSLAGQKADYTYKMLLDYQSGLRDEDHRSELMTILTHDMSKQSMADLAVYYASLSATNQSTDTAESDKPLTLVTQGDPKRLITPCASCHGQEGQGGINASPAIARQQYAAFVRTMQMYKQGQRKNDTNETMRFIAERLSDDEIKALANYYRNL